MSRLIVDHFECPDTNHMLSQKIPLDITGVFGTFLFMQNDFEELARKAVKSAIALDWALARDLNLQILQEDVGNIDAKVRLGKSYLELREYNKARKCFREVLAADPINSVAKKNLELAKEEKHTPATNGGSKNIIQEPATFIQVPAEIVAKGFTAGKIAMGSGLDVKVLAQQVKLSYVHKDQKVELAVITEPKIVKRLKNGRDAGATFTGTFVKGTDKDITVLINSSLPIFDGERQELKPYTKRDFLDSDNEPEVVIEEN